MQTHPTLSIRRLHPGRPARLALALALILTAPPVAAAHFVLHAPASWREQNGLGGPQKLGPCGDEGTAAKTGVVTRYSAGETIPITIDEVIFHPGHYRVALAVNDRGELPAAPAVTPGESPCGSIPIQDPPAFPILVDGALQHTAPFSGTQSLQVTLPSTVTCEHCTLQVLEFMSDHPLPCFYYHCADLSIGAPSTSACTGDSECVDTNACTVDRCDPTTQECTHVEAEPSVCDDGDACTEDTCAPAEGCIRRTMTLADATPGLLGTVQEQVCSGEQVPPAIAAFLAKADTFVARATETPVKARRFLGRASRKLRNAARKATKASGRRISVECGDALSTVLAQARTRIDCLLVGIQ